MANINKELNDIKNAVYGKEVRGSIHDGIKKINEEVENTTDRQDSVEAQFQDVLDETTGKDVISAPEIIAARGGKANLGERLNSIDSDLAQTDDKINRLNIDKLSKSEANIIRNENNVLVQAYLIELDAIRTIINTNYAESIDEGISTGLVE